MEVEITFSHKNSYWDGSYLTNIFWSLNQSYKYGITVLTRTKFEHNAVEFWLCFTYVDKLNLVKFVYGDLVLSLFLIYPQPPQKDTCFKSGQKRLENYLASLI